MKQQDRRFLQMLGHRLRESQEQSGRTLSDLARLSGLSRRHVTEAMAGRANLSVLKLTQLARALKVSPASLLDLPLAARTQRVALVGLRGAGKSTIGRRLGLELEAPLVELDRLIEERAGLSLAQVFDLRGQTVYRRLEEEALETHLESAGCSVLATGGSLPTHEAAYERLLASTHVVWLKASPRDHWDRVVNQGDTRPMAENPQAMDDLKAILEEREPLYARAHQVIDTSDTPIEDAALQIVRSLLDDE